MPTAFSSLPCNGPILRTEHQLSAIDTTKPVFATEPEFEKIDGKFPTKGLPDAAFRRDLELVVRRATGAQVRESQDGRCPHLASHSARNRAEFRPSAPSADPMQQRVSFREGSKAAAVCMLLFRPGGVTCREIMAATGWQAHTVRAFLSRSLAKQGRAIRSFHRDGERVYYTHAEQEPDLAPVPPA
ncbi:MAG: DUF3489 domain-containing protein [Bryobacteraceae bacterium]